MGKPLRQAFHHPLGVCFQLAADEKIIGETRHKALALPPGGTSLPNHSSKTRGRHTVDTIGARVVFQTWI
jgi:hypothetical protein